MRGKTIEVILSEMPATPETIQLILGTVKEIQEDIDTSDNQERKRILRLNIAICEKRIKQIYNQ